MKENNQKILYGDGALWSQVSSEVKYICRSWLKSSSIKETEFFSRVNSDSFEVCFNSCHEISFMDDKGKIGISLTYDKSNDSKYENFLTDAGFLLLYISSKCSNRNSSEKIKIFIKKDILK